MPLTEQNHTRKQILAAAARRLKSAPLDELTMAGVARTARVSRQTLYQHFRDRHDLLASVFIAYAEEHLLPAHNRILDEDLSATGLERVLWADVEASRQFYAELDADRRLRWTVADFMRRSPRMREYSQAMWLPLLRRLAAADVFRGGLDLVEVGRWLSYQQTWLVVAPEAIDPDPAIVRETIRRFIIEPLLKPSAAPA